MTTTKVLTGPRPGTLVLPLSFGQARIAVNPNAATVTVIVSTDDDDGPVADVVNRATGTLHGDRYDVYIPEPTPLVMSTGNTTATFHSSVGFVAQSVHNSNVFVGDQMNVNGIATGGPATSRGDITVEVVLPPNSTVEFDSVSAALTVAGDLSALEANTVSGEVKAETILGRADIRTVSGPVTISHYRGCNACIGTTSGAITLAVAGERRTGRIKADSVSGSIHITNSAATGLTATGSTLTGSTLTGYRHIN